MAKNWIAVASANHVQRGRDVAWFPAQEIAIQALLSQLDFSCGVANWAINAALVYLPSATMMLKSSRQTWG